MSEFNVLRIEMATIVRTIEISNNTFESNITHNTAR